MAEIFNKIYPDVEFDVGPEYSGYFLRKTKSFLGKQVIARTVAFGIIREKVGFSQSFNRQVTNDEYIVYSAVCKALADEFSYATHNDTYMIVTCFSLQTEEDFQRIDDLIRRLLVLAKLRK